MKSEKYKNKEKENYEVEKQKEEWRKVRSR